jgi:nicotinamide-nucleotide amidase
MTAEIISVGTELLLGNILNTNAQYLSRELAALGITVQRQSTVGDNPARLADWVQSAKQRCDLLVFTGGLGPTADDLTKETVAACYGDTLAFDEAEWQKICGFFARTGREVTPNNRKQAMVPVHGRKIVNDHGTAPGAWFEEAQTGRCAVLMPGVPHEMKAMWAEQVRPLLAARQNGTFYSLTLRVLGGESSIEQRIRPLLENENPTAAIYCKTGECEIRITARAATEEEGKEKCHEYAKKFQKILGDAVYDEDVSGIEETVVHTLQAAGRTIATAESCTGGLIAARITAVPGASEVLGSGYVTYSAAAKETLLGVQPEAIARYNVVSAPVAAQMALGALAASGADIAVSVTGLAGPGGGEPEQGRPVGTVYLGAATGETAYVKKLFVGRADRELVRQRAAQAALEMALRLAQGKAPAEAQTLTKQEQHTTAALDKLDAAFVSARQNA